VEGKQPSGKIKDLYDSAAHTLLGELGLSLPDASNKSEWHHSITRPEALQVAARAASKLPARGRLGVAARRPSAVTQRAASTSRATASGASESASSAKCKSESRNKPTVTKPAIQISDADRRRRILITDKSTTTFQVQQWREKGASFRVDRYRCIAGRCLCGIMSAKTKATKTKTALRVRQETYNLSDLKHDPHCGFKFVELGESVSVS
jgi:hypothetical protein